MLREVVSGAPPSLIVEEVVGNWLRASGDGTYAPVARLPEYVAIAVPKRRRQEADPLHLHKFWKNRAGVFPFPSRSVSSAFCECGSTWPCP